MAKCVDDDLSVGPLRDDQTRNEWWAGVYGPYPEAFQPNLYAQWQSLSETLDRLRANETIIWSSNSARDYVFERMAAHMLDSYAGDFFILRVPASGKLEGVPFSSPEALARMERNKLALTADERADWGRSFARDLRRSEGVRRLRQGCIAASFDDSLDQFLLEHCPREWTKWYRVVGNAMADCDGQNPIGDTFFLGV